MRRILRWYLPGLPAAIVYMLQSTEYDPKAYLNWLKTAKNITAVAKRRTLDKTPVARMLLLFVRLLIGFVVAIGLLAVWVGESEDAPGAILLGLLAIVGSPFISALGVLVAVWLGQILIIGPKIRRESQIAERIFAAHNGTTIAVAGSYGKTSMKELLRTVLSEGLSVAATPANKNVALAHAQFSKTLTGNEDILVIEYGEGRPGDVKAFAQVTHPDIGVVTGLAPAHLDQYGTLQAAAQDILSVSEFVKPENLYLNNDSTLLNEHIGSVNGVGYSQAGCNDWKVSNVKQSVEGLSFVLTKGKKKLHLKSKLVGGHHVGPLAFAAYLADSLGLTKAQIEAGVAKTEPFEHRMQPYQLNGAWVIDDTYNGNFEGVKAGLRLLAELNAQRKVYVTPGLVDQGDESPKIHEQIGQAIAEANIQQVYLMKNSVTDYIQTGLASAGFNGELQVIDDPLDFYTNLGLQVAAGDIVLMQNDWTDNYS